MLKNKKTFQLALTIITGLLFITVLGSYIYRLRIALISSTDNYKTTILMLEKEISSLERENTSLRNEHLEYITNSLTENYTLEVAPLAVSLNHISPQHQTNTTRIIAVGHPYGSHDKSNTIPAGTLINAIEEINELDPDLFFTLGDLVQDPTEQSFEKLYQNFLNQLNAPVFNAPGNHDFGNGRTFYEDEFGQTFYFFTYDQSQIIVLDTEITNCFIVGKQKEMLELAILKALENNDIQYVFVFFHKVLFLDAENELRASVNGPCRVGNNYPVLRDEIFLPAAQEKNIYLIAGDVGAFDSNLSPFYAKYPDAKLYTLAVGIGDTENDALLQIDINAEKVEFSIISIGGKEFAPFESYTPEYWAAE